MKWSIIIPLIIAICGWFVPGVIADKPDVRYALSEKISSFTFSGEKVKEDIQQLTVRNVGSTKAEKIRVKISAPINDLEIQKFSQGDKIEQYSSANGQELVYPELPPQGSFNLILRSTDGVISKDIVIIHQNGTAIDALGQKEFSRELVSGVVSCIYLVFFLGWGFLGFQSWFLSKFENEVKWKENDSFLKRKKPFYCSEEKWISFRQEALKRKLEVDKRSYSNENIEQGKIYKILSAEKPVYFSDEEWNELVINYSKNLNQIISEHTNNIMFSSSGKILDILQLEKPRQYDEKQWKDLHEILQKKYISILKCDRYFSVETLFEELKRERPNFLEPNIWNDYLEFIEKKAFDEINQRMVYEKKPLEYISCIPLECFSPSRCEQIMERSVSLHLEKIHDEKSAKMFLEQEKIN